jgi:hypothetical protein
MQNIQLEDPAGSVLAHTRAGSWTGSNDARIRAREDRTVWWISYRRESGRPGRVILSGIECTRNLDDPLRQIASDAGLGNPISEISVPAPAITTVGEAIRVIWRSFLWFAVTSRVTPVRMQNQAVCYSYSVSSPSLKNCLTRSLVELIGTPYNAQTLRQIAIKATTEGDPVMYEGF